MKKIVSLIMCVALIVGAMTMLCGLPVHAAADYEAMTWAPIEITMDSTKTYSAPYMDVDIDAVFTHSDGTKISTPGFWKKDNTWAVRFSPTKVGTWTFEITCSDKDNASLTKTGTINAVANTGDTMIAKHGFLAVSANGRYMTYADGTPFFWLGDTNWQAPNYIQTDACNYPYCTCGNQFKHEVDDRVKKGFNIYQTYFDGAETDGGGQKGKLPNIWKKKFTQPNVDVYNEKIDYMFDYLLSVGMTAALGFGVHTSTQTNILDTEYFRFVRYVVARYSCYSIAWITAQEITDNKDSKTKGKTCFEVYMEGAALTEQLDGYNHPNGAHMYPMYASDDRAKALDAAEWHDWWTLQGGHGAKQKNKDFYQSYYYNESGKVKPVMETEANYEDINCGGFTGYDASRRSAWKAVLCGTAGFTYGVSGVWANCYSTTGNVGWMPSYSYGPWYMGIEKPGSAEVGYMKNFFETIPDWTKLVPRYYEAKYASFVEDETKCVSSSDDGHTYVCYFYNNDATTGTLMGLDASKTYKLYWFDTLTGKFVIGDQNISPAGGVYNLPEKPNAMDWACVVTCEDMAKDFYIENVYVDAYAMETDNAITGEIVKPVKVDAVFGITMNGKQAIAKDPTEKLYDGDVNTAWEPYMDRDDHVIIYDLGKANNLTHLTITPKASHTIPGYRIEVSNDKTTWTILANCALRDGKKDGEVFSEKLSGAYRYVKLLLLNPAVMDKNAAKALSYKTDHSGDQYFIKTSIAELAVYASGEAAEPTKEVKNSELNPTPAPTAEATAAPADPEPAKKGCGSVIALSAAVMLIPAAIVIRKKED